MRVAEIAEITGIPAPYLAKIFQRLSDANIVISKRGYKGGVKLTRSPEEISLLEIDSAIDGAKTRVDCKLDEKTPRSNTFWEAFHHSYREKLAAMTLAEVLVYQSIPLVTT